MDIFIHYPIIIQMLFDSFYKEEILENRSVQKWMKNHKNKNETKLV